MRRRHAVVLLEAAPEVERVAEPQLIGHLGDGDTYNPNAGIVKGNATVTINGGIKIHRMSCPNAPELRRRYGYRIVKARWSGKGASQYSITLRVIGSDDIGIVNNLTSIISKDEKLVLRSINIDSHDGLFSGNLVVMLEDTSRLESLLKKLRTVKGVKQVERI